MEKHGTDFFSKQLYSKVDNGIFEKKHVIIPDVRHVHDIIEIQKRGGIVIKVERTGVSVPTHAWEDAIDNMQGDFTITNNKDMEWVKLQVNQILRNMMLSSPC